MRQMKKKVIIAVLVTLILVAAVAFAIGYFVVNGKNQQIAELESKVVDTKCIAFSRDLKANTVITQSDLTEVDVKESYMASGTYVVENATEAKHYITFIDEDGNQKDGSEKIKREDLIGRVIKANVSKNTLLLDSLLYNKGEEPTIDERLQEFNFLQVPSDLVENEYIDVRIRFPGGEDYSVLIGKKVEKIAGDNTIFIKMDEEEIMAMSSAIIEAYMQDGVSLYANKYTDPATQLFEETIQNYVAKYEYAVEKLEEELRNKELRKQLALLLTEDGMLTVSEPVVDEEGNTISQGNMLNVTTEVIDDELYVTEDMLELIPEEIINNTLENIEVDITTLKDEFEILARYAGIKEEYIKEIDSAVAANDETKLAFYEVMRVTTPKSIIRSYPVRDEVLDVVRNNPNLLETIKEEFSVTATTNTRIDEYKKLQAEYDAAIDDYTRQEIKQKMDELTTQRIGSIEENIKAEVEAQRAERVSYLESLISEEQ